MTQPRNRLFVALVVALTLTTSLFAGVAAAQPETSVQAGVCCLKS